MRISFTIEVEVERVEGKFAAKDDIADEILGWIEGANEGEVGGIGADGESTYEVTDWTVERTT